MASFDAYQSTIKASCIQNEQIRGVMELHEHVVTFEYGSQGYFIYDPYSKKNGGLFEYPNKECFFNGARLIANEYILQNDIEDDKRYVNFQIHQS